MTLQSKAAVSVVDLYLARGRLRAEISMQGFTRLSDLFNNVPGEFIGATMRKSIGGRKARGMVRTTLNSPRSMALPIVSYPRSLG